MYDGSFGLLDKGNLSLTLEEGRYLEFKERMSKTFLKTVSAFANFHDGQIVFGISDKGNVIGVDEPKKLRLDIENSINDNIFPRPYYDLDLIYRDNAPLLVLKVFKGDNTPYVYQKKAYQRHDTASVEVDKLQYDDLVLLGKNLSYELLDYGDLESELRFRLLEKHLQETLDIREVDITVLKSLGLVKNGKYLRAAGLLADKNKFTGVGLDLIAYADDSLLQIKDRAQLQGLSVIEHYEQALHFYNKHVNRRDIIAGVRRTSYEDVPLVAFREAVANAIVHRDYSRLGNNRIEFYDDRIEIVSIGSLPIGISEYEYVNGAFAHPRNRLLMDVFFRIGLIEKLGTGIRRIRSVYAKYGEKPSFIVMKNCIKITLPVIQPLNGTFTSSSAGADRVREERAALLSSQEYKLYNYIQSCSLVSRSDVEEYMGVKKTKATSLLNKLVELKMIKKVGQGRAIGYKIK